MGQPVYVGYDVFMWDDIPMKQQQQHPLARSQNHQSLTFQNNKHLGLDNNKNNKLTHINAATRTTQCREIHMIENQTMQDLANKKYKGEEKNKMRGGRNQRQVWGSMDLQLPWISVTKCLQNYIVILDIHVYLFSSHPWLKLKKRLKGCNWQLRIVVS
jgi:hypothetical protein